jgi:electron transfer flavoprotein alpha subunit
MTAKQIWVVPELNGRAEETSKLSGGLLTEAWDIARKVNGEVTALIFGDCGESYADVLEKYHITRAIVFKHPSLKNFVAEIAAATCAEIVKEENPWLVLMGNTIAGKELAPRLATIANTGVVADCVKMDLNKPEYPLFYSPAWGGQAFQEIVFEKAGPMFVTMNTGVLNILPNKGDTKTQIKIIEPELDKQEFKSKHLEFVPADFRTVDVTEADIIVAVGMGAIDKDILPLVEDLAGLLDGAIGTTRPVADEGKISRERMIGQTGKTVGPELYLALGISGATHHLGGIQEAGKVVSINRDLRAPIFQNSDVGVVVDLKEILPKLIKRIKEG